MSQLQRNPKINAKISIPEHENLKHSSTNDDNKVPVTVHQPNTNSTVSRTGTSSGTRIDARALDRAIALSFRLFGRCLLGFDARRLNWIEISHALVAVAVAACEAVGERWRVACMQR